jgi:predicted RNA-binding protein YlqC (UPF0109 family)
MSSSIDQQFVEFVVKSLVSKPDAVSVERRIDEKGVLLELTVDPEDLGRVIGKRGATAQSLRTLLRALGTKNDARYNLKIIDNGVGGYRQNQNNNDDGSVPSRDDYTPQAQSQDEPIQADEPTNDSETPAEEEEEEHDSVVTKTRKELEEFDDLDV